MEGLSVLIQNAERQGLLHGYRLGRGAHSISLLLFGDDAFFFQCRASIDEGRTLKNILATYKDASGQAINYGKSAFMCS